MHLVAVFDKHTLKNELLWECGVGNVSGSLVWAHVNIKYSNYCESMFVNEILEMSPSYQSVRLLISISLNPVDVCESQ